MRTYSAKSRRNGDISGGHKRSNREGKVLIFVRLIQTSFLSCDEPQTTFLPQSSLSLPPFLLPLSVLVLISCVRQEQVRYVAQCERRLADLARLLLSRTM